MLLIDLIIMTSSSNQRHNPQRVHVNNPRLHTSASSFTPLRPQVSSFDHVPSLRTTP